VGVLTGSDNLKAEAKLDELTRHVKGVLGGAKHAIKDAAQSK